MSNLSAHSQPRGCLIRNRLNDDTLDGLIVMQNYQKKDKLDKASSIELQSNMCSSTLDCLISVPGRLFILRKFSTQEVFIWPLEWSILIIFARASFFCKILYGPHFLRKIG